MPVAGANGPKVIPWEESRGIWAVAYRRPNGRLAAYPVGDKAAAENEANRVAQGNAPTWGPDAAEPKPE
jgi:hypothetical protein